MLAAQFRREPPKEKDLLLGENRDREEKPTEKKK
jgi:hypothetical protein